MKTNTSAASEVEKITEAFGVFRSIEYSSTCRLVYSKV
jgi:hypothetical protein